MCFSSVTPCHLAPLVAMGSLGISGAICPSRAVRILRVTPADAMNRTPCRDSTVVVIPLEASRTVLVSLFPQVLTSPRKNLQETIGSLRLPLLAEARGIG